MRIDAALGYEFQHWASRLALVLARRTLLDSEEDEAELELLVEANSTDASGGNVRLDMALQQHGHTNIMVGEVKWTAVSPLHMLNAALAKVFSIPRSRQRVVVVGSPTGCLVESEITLGTVADLISKHVGQSSEVVYQFQDLATRSLIIEIRSRKESALVVIVAQEPSRLQYEFAKILALRLTLFQPADSSICADTPLDVAALADSVMDPLLRGILDVPNSLATSLRLEKGNFNFPSSEFLLNPWSFLARLFLRLQSSRRPSHYRWVRLLRSVLARRSGGHSKPNIHHFTEAALASRIPPLPIRCGKKRGLKEIEELEASLIKRNSMTPKQDIRLIVGAAGTGKSTLLEFLFGNHLDRLQRGSGAQPPTGLPIFIDLQKHSETLDLLADSPYGEANMPVLMAVLEAFLGTFTPDIWASNPEGSRAAGKNAMAALLSHFDIFLYVDGFDQLVTGGGRDLLANLGTSMRLSGLNVVYLALTSRPDYGEFSAFNWADAFPEAKTPNQGSILQMLPPDKIDLQIYCQSWLDELASILPADRRQMLRAQHFLGSWMSSLSEADSESDGPVAIASDATPAALRANPLMLAMTLSLYMEDIATEKYDRRYRVHTLADLFGHVLESLANSEILLSERSGIKAGGHPELLSSGWLQWFERSCYEELADRRGTPGRISWRRLEETWNAGSPGIPLARNSLALPFVEAKPKGEQEETIEFIHPAFHEYFAARYLARCLASDSFPTIDGGETPSPAQNSFLLQSDRGVATTPLARSLVSVGRDTFKYLLGCLLAHAKETPGNNGLSLLASLLWKDFSLQQYLYDSGYVDRCFDELLAAELALDHQNKDCFTKMIGHADYGVDRHLNRAIARLSLLAAKMASGPFHEGCEASSLRRWYAIFTIDHIENRLDKASEKLIKGHLEGLQPESGLLETDFVSWRRSVWEDVVGDLPIFDAVVEDVPNHHSSLSLVPEPSWDRELLFVLRAGHYWAHVGNRILIRQRNRPGENLSLERNEGYAVYARAIVYRLVSYFMSVGKVFESELLEALGAEVILPEWFVSWHEKGLMEPANLRQLQNLSGLAKFERFVGPAQAIADTAMQFSCRANLLIWEFAFSKLDERGEAFTRFDAEYEVSERLWNLAANKNVRNFLGEGLIRYFLHQAGLTVLRELAWQKLHDQPIWSLERTREEARRQLAARERDYGIGYARAWDGVIETCSSVHGALSQMDHH